MNSKIGVFIVFEGISGCGKSENVESLRSYLVSKGYKTCIIEWNSNKVIRNIVEKMNRLNILTSGIYSFFQWTSFLIDYFFKLIPLLKENTVLVADRYVYTGMTRDIVNGVGHTPGRLIYRHVLKPNLIFFNDIDPVICHNRIKERGKVLFHTNKMIKRNKILKNKSLYYLVKLRREYQRLFSSQMVKKESLIIQVNENSDIIIKYVEDYISGKKEMKEYVKTFY